MIMLKPLITITLIPIIVYIIIVTITIRTMIIIRIINYCFQLTTPTVIGFLQTGTVACPVMQNVPSIAGKYIY